MTFTLEIMLRGNDTVFTEQLEHPGEPSTWTGADMAVVLRKALTAVDRVLTPGSTREVHLRGLNWIVSPYNDAFVLAMEIHSASAVAGPFPGPAAHLERLAAQAVSDARPPQTIH